MLVPFKIHHKITWLVISFFVVSTSCNKFLDAKPSQKLTVINNLQDLQAIIDNNIVTSTDPAASEESSDNYYIDKANYEQLDQYSKNIYIWEKEAFNPTIFNDWTYLYDNVYRANTVLTEINKIDGSDIEDADFRDVYGQGYFLRGITFLKIAEIWALAYDSLTADQTPGIALRLTTDFNETSSRASLKTSYSQIIDDLKNAVRLLPDLPRFAVRASKAAAYGALARTYLSMGQYHNSLLYADSCLKIKSNLIDYNTLTTSDLYPFTRFNDEVIYASTSNSSSALLYYAIVDTSLYNSMKNGDLRKTLFYLDRGNNTYSFKGSYDGSGQLFSGIAVDEILLIRAECHARTGNIQAALADLNQIMVKRWDKNVPYIAFTADSKEVALDIILSERRKELQFRGLRWADIKRLNLVGSKINLTRLINNNIYTLNWDEKRFALQIPANVVELSDIDQNER